MADSDDEHERSSDRDASELPASHDEREVSPDTATRQSPADNDAHQSSPELGASRRLPSDDDRESSPESEVSEDALSEDEREDSPAPSEIEQEEDEEKRARPLQRVESEEPAEADEADDDVELEPPTALRSQAQTSLSATPEPASDQANVLKLDGNAKKLESASQPSERDSFEQKVHDSPGFESPHSPNGPEPQIEQADQPFDHGIPDQGLPDDPGSELDLDEVLAGQIRHGTGQTDSDPSLFVTQGEQNQLLNDIDIDAMWNDPDGEMNLDALESAYNGLLNIPNNEGPQGVRPNETTGDLEMTEADQEDDDDDEKADVEYTRLKKDYERKRKRGRNNNEDDIADLKREREYQRRKIMKQASTHEDLDDVEDAENADESMFIPIAQNDDDDDDEEGPRLGYESPDHEEVAKTPRKPRKKPDPSAAKTSPSGRGKNKQQQKTTKGKGQSKKQLQQQSNLLNATALGGGGNVFQAAQTNRARSEAPQLGPSRRKDIAMKELLASIPEEGRDVAKVDQKQLLQASKSFGRGMCVVRNGEWMVKGMQSLLSHYQMLGSSFMREREGIDPDTGKPTNNPQGGLQCDAMGLGKTVMTIATIMADRHQQLHRPGKKKPQDANVKELSTLIVAPASILHQWRDEIRKHADENFVGNIGMYSGAANMDEYALERLGVVLTTYAQVVKSYPKKEYPMHLVTAQQKDAWWRTFFNANKGPLHTVRWRRVILDEGTCIKNYKSQTSAACAELPGQFRWILTGTPAMNALDEFYSYFRFLSVPHCTSFKLFRRNFVDGEDGKDRLIAQLRPLMLRRTHNSTLLGSKLLNLPEPTQDTFPLPLEPLHYDIYRIVKERFVENINVIARKGELKSKYSNVLTLLLRLKQFIAHPLLIQDCIRELLEDSDFVKIQDKLEEAERKQQTGSQQMHIVQHMRRMLANRDDLVELENLSSLRSPSQKPQQDPGGESSSFSQGTAENDQDTKDVKNRSEQPIDLTKESEPTGLDEKQNKGKEKITRKDDVGAAFGLKDDFYKFLNELRLQGKSLEVGQRLTCARCGLTPKLAVVTSCHHTYCEGCMRKDSQEASEKNSRLNRCKRCGLRYTGTQRYNFEQWEHGTIPKPDPSQPGQAPGPLKKPKVRDIINQWIDTNGNMLPSAKTQAFKAQVLNWFEENPSVKIIVYTQFVTMIEILAKVCEIEGWSYVRYFGGMSTEARASTVKKFGEEPINIFFATLTTGGVGLNLTMATRVLMMDPWWNQAVEQQAFCRTYRRGQTKKTSMMRFAAKNTVDEHILKLQERKEREITSVMGSEQIQKTITMNDLLRLFGLGEDGESSNAFIYPEEGQERGPARWVAADETETMADATDQ